MVEVYTDYARMSDGEWLEEITARVETVTRLRSLARRQRPGCADRSSCLRCLCLCMRPKRAYVYKRLCQSPRQHFHCCYEIGGRLAD